ncbi:hypothetical protein EHQ23_15770 [Leptospira bourretii]|uniref:Uncharacterized protein n=1 Tax=Leptospira bourretii TaxID=2484962 RepID=A0A4R9IQ60_9LEPT|nr:hypothetical protein [Leptospira bourretii]TGK82750.1 hypothetical protein EHQ23_15770 [Leptospira bourretii]TGK94096.1 hypothetical protein EHQ26_03590 [Leptospira bourretii]TGL26261.1 hypothetical protein EHQ47_01115 [Leptospira bourretii]TGL28133.1 hypothetical protein EHQ45_17455 [Leptospira bourretii]
MKKISFILALAVSITVFHCKSGDKTTLEDSRTILEGNWILTNNCATNPSPSATAWLVISNNRDIKSCYKSNSSVVKGLLIKQSEGNYNIDWSEGPASTAQYPVGGPLNLFGMTTQGSTVCYTRVKSAKQNPPTFCK